MNVVSDGRLLSPARRSDRFGELVYSRQLVRFQPAMFNQPECLRRMKVFYEDSDVPGTDVDVTRHFSSLTFGDIG
jgi:hypothetical protein